MLPFANGNNRNPLTIKGPFVYTVPRFDGKLSGKWTLHAAFIFRQTEETTERRIQTIVWTLPKPYQTQFMDSCGAVSRKKVDLFLIPDNLFNTPWVILQFSPTRDENGKGAYARPSCVRVVGTWWHESEPEGGNAFGLMTLGFPVVYCMLVA